MNSCEMDLDITAQEDDRGGEGIEDGDEITFECLLKEGTITDEDTKNIIEDIADDPDKAKELLEILGIKSVDDQGHEHTDFIDGAPISSSILQKLPKSKDVTYESLLAALDKTSLTFQRKDLMAKHCLIDKDLIPCSILARGRKALAAYRRALKNGRTYDKRVKVLLIGLERAGKTSLGKALRGEPLNNDEPRTDGVQINEPLRDASEKRPWKYSNRRSSGYEYNCIEMMNTDGKQPAFDEVDGNCSTSMVALGKDEVGAVPNQISSFPEENLEHDELDTSDGIWPVIWELSGKAVDRAIHPIFMSPDAVYLLVFDISKNLFAKEATCKDSTVHHIMKCVDTVHSIKQSTEGIQSKSVCLVGTHADCVTDGPERKMEQLSKKLCQNPLVEELVVGQFSVDNTQAGQASGKEDPEIVRLRREILEVAKTMPHTRKEIPLHWLKIESEIEQNTRKGKSYVPKGKFKEEIVDKVCTLEEGGDLEQVLQFLHDRGTIIYHDDRKNPDGLVVLDPQWLVNVIRQILNVELSKSETMTACKRRQLLQEEGILTAQCLDDACSKLGVNEIKQSLIFIMEKFNLLCRFQNEPMYIVPCMLTEIREKEIIPETADDGCPPVYLTFKSEYVPVGLFTKLVSLFGAWAAAKSSCQQQRMFANAACFVLDEKNFLGLVCYKSVIKLQVWSDDSHQDSGSQSEVCSFLERSLAVIRDECHWLSSVSWDLSIRCNLCRGKEDPKTGLCTWHDTKECVHEDCAHFMPLKSRPYFCRDAKSPGKGIIPRETYEDWLAVVENNNIQLPKNTISTVQSTAVPFKQDDSKVQVTLLAGEWGSSKGGLPTVNRLLAMELAKQPDFQVTFYLQECSEEDRQMANSHGINIIKAKKQHAYDPLEWLGFRPFEGFRMDVVVGHGVKLGKQVQSLRQFYPKCVWIQFGHTAPEELAMYKNYPCNISKGEEKYENEAQLSALADLVVAVGPKLAEVFRTCLRPHPEKRVFEIVPSPDIFQEFSKCKQAKQDGEKFNVLVFGRGDEEDFEVKGYDLAAKAIAELNDQRYQLFFVGAAKADMEDTANRLLKHGISETQLKVRGFIESREKLANQFCQVDLCIMPSRTEGFGLTALEALTAGLPILVGANSGMAGTLKKLNSSVASSCIVDSIDPKVWASAIRAVKEKPRSQRLQEVQSFKACFEKAYNWTKQCRSLSSEMRALVRDRKGADKDVDTAAKSDKKPDGEEGKKEDGVVPLSLLPKERTETDLQTEDDRDQGTDKHVAKDIIDNKLAGESSENPIKDESEPLFVQEDLTQTFKEPNETKFLEDSASATRRRTSTKDEDHYMKTVKGERIAGMKACNSKEKTRLQLTSLFLVSVLALAFFLSKVF